MALTLYFHPLSSYCHKALIALYENSVPFKPHVVDLGNPDARQEFKKVWPLAKFPVLRDESRGVTIPESTCIIEYLSRHYPGAVQLVPDDPELAAQVRSADRLFDLHLHESMGKVVTDKLRPHDGHDLIGVAQAKERINIVLGMVETQMARQRWAAGDAFSMADCAAAPPLFFINKMMPLSKEFPAVSGYLDRMMQRPSYARALAEAQPFMHFFPG